MFSKTFISRLVQIDTAFNILTNEKYTNWFCVSWFCDFSGASDPATSAPSDGSSIINVIDAKLDKFSPD